MITRSGALGVAVMVIAACSGSSVTDSAGDAAANGGVSGGGTSSGGTSAGTGGVGGSIPGCGGFGGCGNQPGCCNPKTGEFEGHLCPCGPCPVGDIETWSCYAPGECGADKACPAGEFCQYANTPCTGKGACQAGPTSCSADAGPPACGCDGYERSSECDVQVAGQGVGYASSCQISCGSKICTRGLEYCEEHPSNPALTVCKPLPSGCGVPVTCACLAAEPCGSGCMQSEPSHLVCPS